MMIVIVLIEVLETGQLWSAQLTCNILSGALSLLLTCTYISGGCSPPVAEGRFLCTAKGLIFKIQTNSKHFQTKKEVKGASMLPSALVPQFENVLFF